IVAPASRRHLSLDNSLLGQQDLCRLEAGATFFLTTTEATEIHRAAEPQPKNKRPRTHLSQVWISAFRLPCARNRLKPELRTSPRRREDAEIAPGSARILRALLNRETVSPALRDAPRRTPIKFFPACKGFSG